MSPLYLKSNQSQLTQKEVPTIKTKSAKPAAILSASVINPGPTAASRMQVRAPAEMPDEELMWQFQYHRATAESYFAAVYERNCARIYADQRRYNIPFDDLTPQIITVFDKLSRASFDGQRRFQPYLYAISRSVAMDYWRKVRKNREAETCSLDTAPTIHATSALQETETWLRMMELSVPIRLTVYLRYVVGLDVKEVAQLMGCATGTVSERCNRARPHFGKPSRTR